MKDHDFGYFGTGDEGYMHYMQTFHDSFPEDSAHDDTDMDENESSFDEGSDEGYSDDF